MSSRCREVRTEIIWGALWLALSAGCGSNSPPSEAPEAGDSAAAPVEAPDAATGPGSDAGESGGAGDAADSSTGDAAAGGVWTEIPAPPDSEGLRATDAFAAGVDDLFFAVTMAPPSGAPQTTRIIRWNHGVWTTELSFPGTDAGLRPSVHGIGPDDVWAVAGALIYHRDAQGWTLFDDSWKQQATPQTFVGRFDLRRVRAVGAGDVWIADVNHLLHWAAGAWTVYDFDDPAYPNESASLSYLFEDIWIDGPASVWVVGGSDVVGNTMDPSSIHHFDGASWTHLGTGRFGILSLWRADDYDVHFWMAQPGNPVTIDGSERQRTLFRFDGALPLAPIPIAPDSPDNQTAVHWLWGRTPSDVWATGSDVAHFDGQHWSLVTDAPAASRPASSDFDHTFVTGDARSVWLVAEGRFFRMVSPNAP